MRHNLRHRARLTITEQTNHRYELNTKVKLRHDRAGAYALASGDSPAWIRRRKTEYPDIPMVFVEWDQNYWAYGGEPNQWTFEEHFEPVEETQMAEEGFKLDGDELIAFLLRQKEGQAGGTESAPEVEEPESGQRGLLPTVSPEKYAELLSHASEVAIDADAFVVISVSRAEQDDEFKLVPHIVHAYRTDASGLMLEAQLSQIAADLVLAKNTRELQKLYEEQDKD